MATPRDLPRIQQLIRELSAFHDDRAEATLEQLQAIFFDEGAPACAFVARQEGVIIGYAGVQRKIKIHAALPMFDIQHLYVCQKHRAQGVGRALIAAVKAHASALGANGVTIGTAPANKTAQAAYRAMGLAEITDAGPRFWIEITAGSAR
jgi:GNAT superfamily N-acetyltransferase